MKRTILICLTVLIIAFGAFYVQCEQIRADDLKNLRAAQLSMAELGFRMHQFEAAQPHPSPTPFGKYNL